jgi:peptide/nickel transport system permease protein
VRYVGGRIGQGALVVFGAALIGFVVTNLTGNPASVLGGGFLTPEQVRELAQRLGYDKPVLERFADYLANAATGDFGTSYRLGETATSVVVGGLPYTLALVMGATLLALMVSVPLAVVSVLRPGRAQAIVRQVMTFGQGMPEFFVALVLILVFSVQFRWLPAIGYQGFESFVLPVVALAIPIIPAFLRLLINELMEVMGRDFILAARSKHLSDSAIIRHHALPNALPPFVTYIALQLGWLMGGTLIVEIVFGLPGVGTVLLQAVQTRDIVVIQAVVVLLAVSYVVLNLLADVFVLWRDPRIRMASA